MLRFSARAVRCQSVLSASSADERQPSLRQDATQLSGDFLLRAWYTTAGMKVRLFGAACLVTTACLLGSACSGSSGGGSGGSGGGGDPSQHLSAGVLLPDEGTALDDPGTDPSVVVSGGNPPASPAPAKPGDVIKVQIPFQAPQGNVVGAGIRFGASGPIRVIQIPGAKGQTSGVLTFDMQIPSSICDDLSQVCHDIKCYEFAVTEAGLVSAANLMPMALVCGGCDEPSCKSLLSCPDGGGGGGGCAEACAHLIEGAPCYQDGQAGCVSDCEANLAACPTQMASMNQCVLGAQPSCDGTSLVVPGCDGQAQAVKACSGNSAY